MIDSRRLSATLPSTDPVDQRDSLAAAEERIARKTRAAVRRIVVGAYERWLDTLTAAGDMGSFDGIPGEWEQFVNGELADDIGAVFDDGALSTWATLPEVAQAVGSLAEGWMTVVNESAVNYQLTATNRLRGVGETMWNDVKQIVAQGVQAGENNEELKQRIERVTSFSEFRADTIARTETIAAYNGGNAASAEALGDFGPTEKVWLAGIDARTRPTHVEANNQTVPFGSPFIVGGVEMMRPHDPGSPAREVVNCRCILQVLYPGDLRPDGTMVPERNSATAVAQAEGITPAAETATLDPAQAQTQMARERRAAQAREAYLERRATPETAAEYAKQYGIHPDQVIRARQEVLAVRAQVRESAARHAGEIFGTLDDVGGLRLHRPTRGAGTWDGWELLSDGEKKRLGRYVSTRRGQGRIDFDELAENARNRGYVLPDATDDDVFDWWLQQTRTLDQAGAIAKGRLPAPRSYGRIDTQLAARTDVDVDDLFGVHLDEAAARRVAAELVAEQREYLRVLDAAVRPVHGDPPWRYGFQTWEEEVRELAFGLDNFPDELPSWAAQRLEELFPSNFRFFDSLEDAYAALIDTARQAGMEVADYAIIPWA